MLWRIVVDVAACEPLRPKVEAMKEFALVAWSIQAKVKIYWSRPVWLELPQAQAQAQAQAIYLYLLY